MIGYREVFFEDATSSLCLVMDYADGGDVLQKINTHTKRGSTFPESEIWSIFIQLVKGLAALHKRKILHRDIKVGTTSPPHPLALPANTHSERKHFLIQKRRR